MRRKMRRIISSFLAAMIIFTSVDVSVFAAPVDTEYSIIDEAEAVGAEVNEADSLLDEVDEMSKVEALSEEDAKEIETLEDASAITLDEEANTDVEEEISEEAADEEALEVDEEQALNALLGEGMPYSSDINDWGLRWKDSEENWHEIEQGIPAFAPFDKEDIKFYICCDTDGDGTKETITKEQFANKEITNGVTYVGYLYGKADIVSNDADDEGIYLLFNKDSQYCDGFQFQPYVESEDLGYGVYNEVETSLGEKFYVYSTFITYQTYESIPDSDENRTVENRTIDGIITMPADVMGLNIYPNYMAFAYYEIEPETEDVLKLSDKLYYDYETETGGSRVYVDVKKPGTVKFNMKYKLRDFSSGSPEGATELMETSFIVTFTREYVEKTAFAGGLPDTIYYVAANEGNEELGFAAHEAGFPMMGAFLMADEKEDYVASHRIDQIKLYVDGEEIGTYSDEALYKKTYLLVSNSLTDGNSYPQIQFNIGFFDRNEITPGKHNIKYVINTVRDSGGETYTFEKNVDFVDNINTDSIKYYEKDNQAAYAAENSDTYSFFNYMDVISFEANENIAAVELVMSETQTKVAAVDPKSIYIGSDKICPPDHYDQYDYYFGDLQVNPLSLMPSVSGKRLNATFTIKAANIKEKGYADVVYTTKSGKKHVVKNAIYLIPKDVKDAYVMPWSIYMAEGSYDSANVIADNSGDYISILVYKGVNLSKNTAPSFYKDTSTDAEKIAYFDESDPNCAFEKDGSIKDYNVYYYTLKKTNPNDEVWNQFNTFGVKFTNLAEDYDMEYSAWYHPRYLRGVELFDNKLRIFVSPRFAGEGDTLEVTISDITRTAVVNKGPMGLYVEVAGDLYQKYRKYNYVDVNNTSTGESEGSYCMMSTVPAKKASISVPSGKKWEIHRISDIGSPIYSGVGGTSNPTAVMIEELAATGDIFRLCIKNSDDTVSDWQYFIPATSSRVVSYDPNGGQFEDPALSMIEQKVADGSVYGLPYVTRVGYDFAGWYTASGAKVNAGSAVTIKDDHTLVARWTAKKYTVKFDIGSTTYGKPSGAMADYTAVYDKEFGIPANRYAMKGYVFAGWRLDLEDYSYIIYGNLDKVTDNLWDGISENNVVTLTATWTPAKYTVSYKYAAANDPEGTKQSMNTSEYTVESGAHSLPKFGAIAGYDFEWYKDSKCTQVIKEIPEDNTDNVVVYGKWTPVTYRIEYYGNEYTNGKTMKDQTVAYGKAVKLTKNVFARNDGYYFGGWNTERDGSGDSYANTEVVKNVFNTNGNVLRLYAQWIPTEYAITYKNIDKTTDNTMNPATYNVKQGSVALKEPVRPGYTFGGFYTTPRFVEGTQIEEIDCSRLSKITVYAKWIANTYTIVFDANGADNAAEVAMDSITCTYNKGIKLPANKFQKDGYVFIGWVNADDYEQTYRNMDIVKQATTVNGGTVTLKAYWSSAKYTIYFEPNGADNGFDTAALTKMASREFVSGKATALPANAFVKKNYTFAGWAVYDPNSDYIVANKGKVIFAPQVGDPSSVSLFAQWVPTKYKITYKNVDKSTMNENAATYTVVDPVVLADPVKAGYTFMGWYADSKFTIPVSEIREGGNVTVYAKFVANSYWVIYSSNGADNDGEAEIMEKMAQTEFVYNKAKALAANAYVKNGYKFVAWNTEIDGTGITYKNKASLKTAATGGFINLYAMWSPEKFAIVYDGNGADNNGWVTIPKQNVQTGKKFKIAPNSYYRTNYVFTGWNTRADGTGVSIKAGSTITDICTTDISDGTVTLYAQWTVRE